MESKIHPKYLTPVINESKLIQNQRNTNMKPCLKKSLELL